MSEKLTFSDVLLKRAPQYVKDFVNGRINRGEFEEQRKAYWEPRGYVVTASGLEPKELIDKGVLVMQPNGSAAINTVEVEVPARRAGQYETRLTIDPRYFEYLEREEKRIDSAIRASTYADHVAEYYADEEEAW